VELLTTLAIVSILTSVAASNYQCMVLNALRAEATVALGAIYKAEKIYFQEYSTYTACIRQAGFEYDLGTKRHFSVGFGTSWIFNNCGTDFATSCAVYGAYDTPCLEKDTLGSEIETASDINYAANSPIKVGGAVIISFSENPVPKDDWENRRSVGLVDRDSFYATAFAGAEGGASAIGFSHSDLGIVNMWQYPLP